MNTHLRDDKGFTLVELAVVMVIIGLLIGGILKGQEMIENARMNSTISQFKAVDAAFNTFRDMYDALPGDMADSNTRITGAPAAGDGNNEIGALAPFAMVAAPAGENLGFFQHIGGADLLAGATANMTEVLEADLNGIGFGVGIYNNVATALGLAVAGTARTGHYVTAQNFDDATANGLTPLQAGRIDRKLDDGDPGAGSVISAGTATCGTAGGSYAEIQKNATCKVAVRLN